MLISFSVKNFLSFKEVTNFSMVAGDQKLKEQRVAHFDNNLNLLKFAAIYGANASGKSNFVKALNEMAGLVVFGPRKNFTPSFYCLDDKCKNEDTYFEVTVALGKGTYIYGFEYSFSKNIFTSEWFLHVEGKTSDEKVLFERDLKKATFTSNFDLSEKSKNMLDVFVEECKHDDKKLFLSYIAEKKQILNDDEIKPIKEMHNWFLNKLDITNPNTYATSPKMINQKMGKLSELLKKYDTGIEKLIQKPIDAAEVIDKIGTDDFKQYFGGLKNKTMAILRSKRFLFFGEKKGEILSFSKLTFQHKVGNCSGELSIASESDGTIRILDLAEILLSSENDKVFVVDEFDRCLHPLLTLQFINDFLKLAAQEKNRNQLIITTHETQIMDLKLLRRDEIWFADKEQNVTSLYSLEEFKERFDKKVDKQYLEGRYGSIPLFDDNKGVICKNEN